MLINNVRKSNLENIASAENSIIENILEENFSSYENDESKNNKNQSLKQDKKMVQKNIDTSVYGDLKDKKITIQSRFGEIEADLSKAIYFPKGLYGFADNLHFVLVNFPHQNDSEFKILQCLNDSKISFPVLPSAYVNNFINGEDMKQCIESIEVKEENFAMFFIASSRKNAEGNFEISINTKAPIVLDVKLQIAVQYVFTNNKYSIKHKIN